MFNLTTYNTKSVLLLLVVSIFLQSFSLLCIKLSTLQGGYLSVVLLVVSFGFIGFRTLVWQNLLRECDLSSVYPYASLVQVLILLYAAIIFHEPVTLNNIIGLNIMLIGVFAMSR